MSTTDYIIKVKTSDRLAAGTDANVCLQLFGEHGVSQTFELKKSQNPNKFERNELDEFKFLNVREIGALERLKVWHDNTGTMPSWHLEFIEISDTTLSKMFRFPCHQWIGGNCGHHENEAILRCMETLDGPKFVDQVALGVPNPHPARKVSIADQIKEALARKDSK